MKLKFNNPFELSEYVYEKSRVFPSVLSFMDWLQMKADEDQLSISCGAAELPPDQVIDLVPYLILQHKRNWGFSRFVYKDRPNLWESEKGRPIRIEPEE